MDPSLRSKLFEIFRYLLYGWFVGFGAIADGKFLAFDFHRIAIVG